MSEAYSNFQAAAKDSLSDEYVCFDDVRHLHAQQYKKNPFVALMHTDEVRENINLQDSLLDVLQVWSDHFQRLIRIRAASVRSAEFAALADRHMQDEFNHNHILAETRGNRPVHIWDATIEGAVAWFAERMSKGSDVEATILMHLVIEESGDIFFNAAAVVFPNSRHFDVHSAADEGHTEIGLRALKEKSREPVEQMIDTLNKGWAIMNLLCARMAEVAITNAVVPAMRTSAELAAGEGKMDPRSGTARIGFLIGSATAPIS